MSERTGAFTGCFSKAGLVDGTSAATIQIAAPNGAGIDFAINGIAYHKADTDNIAVTAATQASGTTCLYLVQINAAGTVSTKQGNAVATADLGVVGGALQWPQPDANNCPIGGYKIKATAAYVNGTTDQGTGNLVDYFDFIGGLPGSPESTTAT
jgi:hypothetical protein